MLYDLFFIFFAILFGNVSNKISNRFESKPLFLNETIAHVSIVKYAK